MALLQPDALGEEREERDAQQHRRPRPARQAERMRVVRVVAVVAPEAVAGQAVMQYAGRGGIGHARAKLARSEVPRLGA